MNFFKSTHKKSPEDKQTSQTNFLSQKEIDDASKANGTAVTDLVENLDKVKFEQPKEQLKQLQQESKARRKKYIEQRYGKLNWDSEFTLLKILYKDFSTRLFFTIVLCLIILSLALAKIYISRASIETTVKYSQLLADKNSLVLSNDNLQLEFLSLTSRTNIIRITQGKISLIPIPTEAEVIVVIPYLPQNKTLPTPSIPLLTPPQE